MRYLQRRGTRIEDAEDLLQDLSEIVLRRRLPEHPDAAAQWMFTCLRWLITRRRRLASSTPTMAEVRVGEPPLLDELPDQRHDPEHTVVGQIVCDDVMVALESLRRADRELLLAVADGTPAADLARQQGVSRQAMSERVSRARRHLVESLPYDVFEA
jgi:RNA polymerase sigma factor (sigma-70 family)